jgi:hypothetical protein
VDGNRIVRRWRLGAWGAFAAKASMYGRSLIQYFYVALSTLLLAGGEAPDGSFCNDLPF